jgi:hypothetical protein
MPQRIGHRFLALLRGEFQDADIGPVSHFL